MGITSRCTECGAVSQDGILRHAATCTVPQRGSDMVPLAAGVSVQDPVEIRPGEFHPAARQAYRWLKGFMITNREDYEKYRTELSRGAETGNRQARICVGTIRRLQEGEPVSDRYLLGLAWTIIALHNPQMVEAVADQRWDRAHGPHEDELLESS